MIPDICVLAIEKKRYSCDSSGLPFLTGRDPMIKAKNTVIHVMNFVPIPEFHKGQPEVVPDVAHNQRPFIWVRHDNMAQYEALKCRSVPLQKRLEGR